MLTYLVSPFILMTLTVFFGMILGTIRFRKFSFSTSGAMFIGILIGWRVVKFLKTIEPNNEFYDTAQNILSKNTIDKGFFDLFLILFIASVGLLAAKDVGRVIKAYGIKFILLGFVITFIGAVTTYGISLIGPKDNPYLYSGVYTGALTSSPGLASSIETATMHSSELVEKYDLLSYSEKQKILNILGENAHLNTENTSSLTEEQKNNFIKIAEAGVGTGYAVGYPFGLVIVIFAINFLPIIFKIDIDSEKILLAEDLKNNSKQNDQRIKEVYFDLSAFTLVCIIGYFIGILKISLGSLDELSLGSTGGVLVSALVLGHIGNIGSFCFRMNNRILGILREISIAYFFAIAGLRFGYQVVVSLTGPGLTLVVASIFIASIALTLGFLIGKYVFKINWVMLSGAICGGMTSTPGLGAAIDVVGSNEPAASYGAVYPFALIGMVLFSNILNHIV